MLRAPQQATTPRARSSSPRDPSAPKRGRPKKPGAGLPHLHRPPVSPHQPHHVTVRVRRGTWNLRSQRCFRLFAAAFGEVKKREGFRVTHFSVQGNHMHMLAEASDRRAMSNGVRALLIRIAKQLNTLMHTRGPRFADRFHERILTDARQVRNAVRYVIDNHARHLAQVGKLVVPGTIDRFCSLAHPRLVARPESCLLKTGWPRAGPD